MSKSPYHSKFNAEQQVNIEERIASRISELTDGTIEDEVAAEIGRDALYIVVCELRTDLLHRGLSDLVKKEKE